MGNYEWAIRKEKYLELKNLVVNERKEKEQWLEKQMNQGKVSFCFNDIKQIILHTLQYYYT